MTDVLFGFPVALLVILKVASPIDALFRVVVVLFYLMKALYSLVFRVLISILPPQLLP